MGYWDDRVRRVGQRDGFDAFQLPWPAASDRPAAAPANFFFFSTAAEFLLRKSPMLLASPLDAAGDSGYEKVRVIAGGDVGEAGA